MRILVTNDDGVDAPGLLALAQAMTELGEVVVVAPDREFSGAGAAIGAIWEFTPHVTRRRLDGITEAWAVNGPPALCVMYARLGAFGDDVDLVVSGINPGANVGRSVYHSGTVGACLSGRNGGWSGVAVSQAVTGWGVEGQGYEEAIKNQKFHVAADVAQTFVRGLIDGPPDEVVIANINVPNVELDEIEGWRLTRVGVSPPRAMARAQLVPTDHDPDHFDVDVAWGDRLDLPEDTDGGAIERNVVSVSYLTRLQAERRDDLTKAEVALDGLLGRNGSS
ncbi:MAG: 5'/3'-nucleotidase SurE [Ilumatobacter sp.]|uniref:5'/3'-nucleotidase SurE n=1 Tax=Ilumatobacter sp. TaxID=1967498 RepID=UPI0026215D0A|nr:5'/3'-nucleotidase SurE [Ilumatobacter sp.]MDJ0767662.1 5'/3'-nucleotidase SurE [Ilumatobacter sp.]